MKKNAVAVAVMSAALLTACGGGDSSDVLPVYLVSEIKTVAIDANEVETPHSRKTYEYKDGRLTKVTVYGAPVIDAITGLSVEPIIYYSTCSYTKRTETSGFRDRQLEMRNARIDSDGNVETTLAPNCARGSNNDDGKIVEKIYLGPTEAQLAAAADAEGDLVETLTLALTKDSESSRAIGSTLTIDVAGKTTPIIRNNHYVLDANYGLKGIVTEEVVTPALGTPSVETVAYHYSFYGDGLISLRDRIDRPDATVTDPAATLEQLWFSAKAVKENVERGLVYQYPDNLTIRISEYQTLGSRQLSCQTYKAEDGRTKTVTTATAAVNDDWCDAKAPRLVDTYFYTTM